MHGWQAWATAGAAWLVWVCFTRWLLRPAFRDADISACAALRVTQVYARLLHRLRVEGAEHIPLRRTDGFGERPLVIVANHTAGIDPILIQAALPFEVRWVMAEDMGLPRLQWAWDFGRIIFVDRETGGGAGLREALRHLQSRGTLGLFPEGSIERPARRLLPFKEGVGLLIARTRALVLPVVVEGTPQVDPAWASFTRVSRSMLRFLPPIDFFAASGPRPDPRAIAAALRDTFVAATGWPRNEYPPRFEKGVWWYVDEAGTYRPAHEVESRK